MAKFYDGTKLLSMKDINGNTPEIFICTTNRSAGKTTFFNKWCVNRFIKHGEKFGLIYRFNYEMDDCSEKFFKDIQGLFFQEYEMIDKSQNKGMYHELFLKKKNEKEFVSCGYALSLNNSDQIKKLSHLFSDIKRMLFDEFQSETEHYCYNEVKKFQSIHTSIARGQGKQSRYVPVIMISNPVSIINPYYSALGISSRLTPETNFLRGRGFVLENGFNDSAAAAITESVFNSAFDDGYNDYNTKKGVFLNDSNTFIEKISGSYKYLFTLKCEGKFYSVSEVVNEGVIYVSDRYDKTFKIVIAVDVEDHNVNYVLLSHYDKYIAKLKFFFERGCFRFKNQACKSASMKLLNYYNY